MSSEAASMQKANVREIKSYVADHAGLYPEWEMLWHAAYPGDPGGWNEKEQVNYENSLYIRCRRPCCLDAPDEVAHHITVFCVIDKDGKWVRLGVILGGLVDEEINDEIPTQIIDAPTVESVLEAGRKVFSQIPEWMRILTADTLDWGTRFEMRGW